MADEIEIRPYHERLTAADVECGFCDPDDQRYWPMMSGQPFDPRDVKRREDLFRALIEYGDAT